MKSFGRNRNKPGATPDGASAVDAPELLDLDELDIAPIGLDAPAAPPVTGPIGGALPETDEAGEFAARLGDLDRFIGGPAAPAPRPAADPAIADRAAAVARNLVPPALQPISHPRPTPPADTPVAAAAAPADPEAEAQDFLDRLGDLDRFIGGPPSGQVPVVGAERAPAVPVEQPGDRPVVDAEDEAQEFLDRLGDLDRFIGGGEPPR